MDTGFLEIDLGILTIDNRYSDVRYHLDHNGKPEIISICINSRQLDELDMLMFLRMKIFYVDECINIEPGLYSIEDILKYKIEDHLLTLKLGG